ncbi:MAG TPA: hypothetical protein VNI52_04925 [Sphingobacteriaceae bacterium]|nr:hypothetical protein [Sphingobacteriaceae bacterium]
MRSINIRDLLSTPGQLYYLRSEPLIINILNGLSSGERLAFLSCGRIDLN